MENHLTDCYETLYWVSWNILVLSSLVWNQKTASDSLHSNHCFLLYESCAKYLLQWQMFEQTFRGTWNTRLMHDSLCMQTPCKIIEMRWANVPALLLCTCISQPVSFFHNNDDQVLQHHCLLVANCLVQHYNLDSLLLYKSFHDITIIGDRARKFVTPRISKLFTWNLCVGHITIMHTIRPTSGPVASDCTEGSEFSARARYLLRMCRDCRVMGIGTAALATVTSLNVAWTKWCIRSYRVRDGMGRRFRKVRTDGGLCT